MDQRQVQQQGNQQTARIGSGSSRERAGRVAAFAAGSTYFIPCRRVKATCPTCGGSIADRGALRSATEPGYAPATRCRNCLEIFKVGRVKSEGAA